MSLLPRSLRVGVRIRTVLQAEANMVERPQAET
jgi:hypothetical protein